MSTLVTNYILRPDGARLATQVAGPIDAPVLLLLQGQASSHDWWTGLRERYHHRFRTVSMDYRGTGSTEAPDGELSTELLAEDAAAVLDDLDVAQAHIYGTSMGGRVGQMVAIHYAPRVRSLVLACTSPGGPQAVERSNEVRKALINPDPDARRAATIELFYTPAWSGDPTISHLFGDPTITPANRQRHLKMSARHNAWDLLDQIRCATLVLHGAQDRMTPSVNADLITSRIPDTEHYIHPSGRHGFFEEFADDLEPLLSAFWD